MSYNLGTSAYGMAKENKNEAFRQGLFLRSSCKFEGHTEDLLKLLSGLQELLESERESTIDFHEFLHRGRERLRSSHAGHMKAVLGPTTPGSSKGSRWGQ